MTAETHIGVEVPFAPALKAHPAFQVAGVAALEAVAERLIMLGFDVDWSQRHNFPGTRGVTLLTVTGTAWSSSRPSTASEALVGTSRTRRDRRHHRTSRSGLAPKSSAGREQRAKSSRGKWQAREMLVAIVGILDLGGTTERFWLSLQTRSHLEIETDHLGAALEDIQPLRSA